MNAQLASAEELLSRHGRSFHLAARFLPAAACKQATRLYAFCRLLDDLADAAGNAEQSKIFLSNLSLELTTSSQPISLIYSEIGLNNDLPAQLFIRALAEDTGPRQLLTLGDLIRYSYGVAGTVGLMMADILSTQAKSALPHALDLGVAMQLVNISRDVLEDAGRERVYLPAVWLPANVSAADLRVDPTLAWGAVQQALQVAEAYFQSGFQGLHYLPENCRRGIWIAGRVYREIGKEILRQGPSALSQRTVVPRWRKIAVALKCRLTPWQLTPFGSNFAILHDSKLHQAMTGFFGTHSC